MRSCIALILMASALTGCEWLGLDSPFSPSAEPAPAHAAAGGRLDVSSETVDVALAAPGFADDLTRWINQEQPASAELACADADPSCQKAWQILQQFAVPVTRGSAAQGKVTLYYQHVAMCSCTGGETPGQAQCTAPVSTVKVDKR